MAGTLGHVIRLQSSTEVQQECCCVVGGQRETRDGKMEVEEGKEGVGPRKNRLGIPGDLRFLCKS